MLKTFVAEEEYPKLLDILIKLKENKLNKEVSIIELFGDGSNGKTTLQNFMLEIAKCQKSHVNLNSNTMIDGSLPVYLSNPLFTINEDAKETQLKWFNEVIKGIPINGPNHRAGVGILTCNNLMDLNYDVNATRKVIQLHLPNYFNGILSMSEIIEKCKEEFMKEYEKYLDGEAEEKEEEYKPIDFKIKIVL
ncbi:MAG: hypothetical protein MUO21_00910 [Nitrososphaeraceae archaeon]|nr:hypothetical protein [Nitrososphaeraceae archaeon]